MSEILPFEDPVVCIEVSFFSLTRHQRSLHADVWPDWLSSPLRSTVKVFGTPSKAPYRNGLLKKGRHSSLIPSSDFYLSRRFPIVAGISVEWDHSKSPGKRVNSIKLVNPAKKEDDEIDNPEEMVNFVEQEDGTTIDVKQRKVDLGDDIRNESGGRTYRVVSR